MSFSIWYLPKYFLFVVLTVQLVLAPADAKVLSTKATVNCLAAEAKGASCASGALGTLVTEFGLSDPRLLGATSPQDFQKRLELVAAIAGFIASEGQAQNVNATAGAAMLDFENNQGMGGAAALAQMQTLIYMNNSCMSSGGSAQACELVLQEFQKGFLAGQQEAALLLIDFIPVVGDIKALAECIQTPTPAICGAAGVSLIPGAGDVARIVVRKGDEVLEMTVAGGKVIDALPSVNVPRSIGAAIPSQPVNNINEFFNTITGDVFKLASTRTGKTFQGQQIFKANKDIVLQDGSRIRKGDQFYLDGLHKDHLEVFDSRGNPRIIVDLAGNKVGDQVPGRKIP